MKYRNTIYFDERVYKGKHQYLLSNGKWVSRQRVWQLAHEHAGLCVRCSDKALPGRDFCLRHLAEARKRSFISNRKARGIPLSHPKGKHYNRKKTT